YLHTSLGYNSRLDAIQAAVLNVKLPKLEAWISKRTAIAERYRDALADLNGLTLPTAEDGHSWNQFVVRIGSCPSGQTLCNASCTPSTTSARHGIPESCCRDWVKQTLQEHGVSTIIYYPIPIHRQPAYAHPGLQQGSLPVTEQLCSQVLSLPIFPELRAEQQQQVVDTLTQMLGSAAPTPLIQRSGKDRMVA
ncbi:MAG: DegT/DnrJ/EryC1/StrS family aminotransferase, partial [Cyanobacteriota bacterium]|nr:DegT/DnrJ/EryC1/StrS family aminotransferase [Cyanobacteriota bacterium]